MLLFDAVGQGSLDLIFFLIIVEMKADKAVASAQQAIEISTFLELQLRRNFRGKRNMDLLRRSVKWFAFEVFFNSIQRKQSKCYRTIHNSSKCFYLPYAIRH